jgi:transposase
MRDVELYRHLLGLESPWTVSRVELNAKEQRVDVWAEHGKGARWPCPECQEGNAALAIHDHAPERSWRHLDSCQYMTYLHARPPRVNCPNHGVKQVRLPWAEPKARFTALFERFAIDVLLETDILGATKILTLVSDIDRGTIEYIADDRKTESLSSFFVALTPEQRDGIDAIAMDMWEPYEHAIYANITGAAEKVVFDRFHIMKHVGEAVDKVRKQEHRELQAQGDNTLAKSKYLWLYAEENLPEKSKPRFEELRRADLKTGRAWSIKESLRRLWGHTERADGEEHWRRWYFWATHSRLAPMIAAARTIRRHLNNVLTYFKHRITNAVSEGLNSKIQTIKKRAYGFRNNQNFKTAIYFHCGGLDLYPVGVGVGKPHKIPG